VVERTFAWLGRYRRLSKDDEALPGTEDAWIYLAMIRLLLARLTLRGLFRHPLKADCRLVAAFSVSNERSLRPAGGLRSG
jgi:hypothetical protein